MPPDLGVQLGRLRLKSPIVCGSGEHVWSEEGLVAAVDAGAAAVVAKSANESEDARRQARAAAWVLLDERWREVPPDAAPREASLFNRSGLVPLPWAEWLAVLARADAHARTRDAHVVASIIPADLDELPRLARDVEAAGLRWIELNLSAPHAAEARDGAIHRPAAPAAVREATSRVRAAVSLPLTVKLTAEADDLVALAAAARAGGADAVAMTGRHAAFLPDPRTRRPVLGTFGAIGGPWGLPLALRWIAKARLALGPELPLIGTNGARDGLDVARFLLAGARAVQVTSSVLIEGFGALARIRDELEAYLAEQGVDAAAIVGEAADAAVGYLAAADDDEPTTPPTLTAAARIACADPERLARQTARHFGHKVPVHTGPDGRAEVELPTGRFTMQPEPGALAVRAEAPDRPGLQRVQEVAGDHLRRFARPEQLEVAWRQPSASGWPSR